MQLSYDPLDYAGGAKEAKRERDAKWQELKNQGKDVQRWVLRNQLQKYASFGVEDGRVRDVYFINVM